MLSLYEIQHSFGKALTRGKDAAIAPFIVDRGLQARVRIGIYRNNVEENFAAALCAGFPVLRRLVGDEYFRQMTNAYRRECPSRFGNLFNIGAQLANFLESELAGSDFEYLSDVARLEWLCQESAAAAEARPLPVARLARIDPEKYELLQMYLHPAVRLLKSPYPLMQIWRQNQPDGDADAPIDLSVGGDRLLIRCLETETELRRLSAGEYHFLSALQAGRTLYVAHAFADTAQPGFDLPEQLKRWVGLQILTDFSIIKFNHRE